MSENPIMSFQELETVLRIIDAAPRNGTVDITLGDLKLSVTRGDASARSPQQAPVSSPQPAPAPAAPAAAPAAQSSTEDAIGGDGPSASTTRPAEDVAGHVIESPMTGVFYRQPEPGADPFVSEGERVEAGDVVAIIEVMKLMNRLTSPVSGIVRQVCAENEGLVEHGAPLFIIDTDGEQ